VHLVDILLPFLPFSSSHHQSSSMHLIFSSCHPNWISFCIQLSSFLWLPLGSFSFPFPPILVFFDIPLLLSITYGVSLMYLFFLVVPLLLVFLGPSLEAIEIVPKLFSSFFFFHQNIFFDHIISKHA
jgi:hypothetical protein